MNIDEIVLKLQNGDFELTPEEADLFIKSYADIHNKGEKAKVKSAYTAEEFASEIDKAMEVARQSPEFTDRLKQRLIDSKTSKFTSQYGPLIKAVIGGADIAASLKQIRAGDRAGSRLRRPAIPVTSGIDPAIDRALRDSEQATLNAPTAVNAARRVIDDQFNQDQVNARTASGGQQAAYGALSQVGATRRTRGSANLAPIVNQIRQQELANRNQLLGLKQNAVQNIDRNNLYTSRLAQDQYNQDALAAGQLGATGRLNLRNSLGTMANLVPQVAARATRPVNPYLPQTQAAPRSQNYSPVYGAYEDNLNGSLIEHLRGYQSPTPRINQTGPNFDVFNNIKPLHSGPTVMSPNYLKQTYPVPPMIQTNTQFPYGG